MPKILDTQYITGVVQQPIKKGTLDFIQDAHMESLSDFIIAHINGYDPTKVYILWGCNNISNPPIYTLQPGAMFYNGRVYHFDGNFFTTTGTQIPRITELQTQYTTDADPVTFTDASTHNVHNIIKFTVAPAAAGSGLNYNNAVFLPLSNTAATKTDAGTARLATLQEAIDGSDDTTIVTPLDLAAAFSAKIGQAWVSANPNTPTYANASGYTNASWYWMVIGKTVYVRFKYRVTSGGTTGLVSCTFSFPSVTIAGNTYTLVAQATAGTATPINVYAGSILPEKAGSMVFDFGGDFTKFMHVFDAAASATQYIVSGTVVFEIQ